MSEKDIESLSDEEIMNTEPPSLDEGDSTPPQEPTEEPEQDTTDESSGSEEQDQAEEPSGDDEPEEDNQPQVDYQGFYNKVMSPIKANGKTFNVRNPDEAIRLMQMGVNYTQKMQSIAPYRKKIQTLQKAGLLDDDKLNYLIDLASGNKDAITKLLRDSKLDPLDIDTRQEAQYVPRNHTVSDSESHLQTVLDDITSTPEGRQIVELAKGWDQASLVEVGNDPSILATLAEQRQNGVFDLITREMDRQKVLGTLSESTPFLQAYKTVGEYCLRNLQAQNQQMQQSRNLPRGTLNQGYDRSASQVKSAAPSGRSKKVASKFVDPFSLSDEDFEKQFAGYN